MINSQHPAQMSTAVSKRKKIGRKYNVHDDPTLWTS